MWHNIIWRVMIRGIVLIYYEEEYKTISKKRRLIVNKTFNLNKINESRAHNSKVIWCQFKNKVKKEHYTRHSLS